MMQMIHENQQMLLWLGGILVAGFIFAVVGGWIGRAGIILTLTVGFILAFPALAQQDINLPWTKNVTPEGVDKIAYSVVAIGVMAILLSFRKVPTWARLIVAVVAPAVAVGSTLWPHTPGWTIAADKWTTVWEFGGGTGVVAGLLWLSTETIAVKQKGVAPVLVTGLFAAGAAGMLANTGEMREAMLAVIVGFAILGSFLGGLFAKRPEFHGGPILIWIAPLSIMLGYGASNSDEKSPLFLAIVCAAPLLAWVGQIKRVSKWKPWKRELLRGLFVAAPIVTVLVLASMRSKKAAESTSKTPASDDGGWNYGS